MRDDEVMPAPAGLSDVSLRLSSKLRGRRAIAAQLVLERISLTDGGRNGNVEHIGSVQLKEMS